MRIRSRLAATVVGFLTLLWVVLPVGLAVADEERQSRQDILISKDSEFDTAHGVRGGSGTSTDPYVISGWRVNRLHIRDTAAWVIITNNEIGRLTLNWIGPGVYVYDNVVRDLRVNENVKRTGEMTSGHIFNNQFGVVGQLRHFDGIFEKNVVGAPSDAESMPNQWFSHRAVNFDGFNGSHFRDNTIYGYVDVRLHGHHHGSGFGEASHYHGAAHADHEMMDHTKRFHQVWVTDNTIYSDNYWALRYFDQAHAANDRTAASETNQELNKPHVHHTRVYMTGNKLIGSGISVDIFNANDQRHLGTKPGLVVIKNNDVTLGSERDFSARDGISVYAAKDLTLEIVGNTIRGYSSEDIVDETFARFHYTSGIRLYDMDLGFVYLYDNTVTNRNVGIYASFFTNKVFWWVDNLSTSGVDEKIRYERVPNKPNEGQRPQ